jgi:hypothetical protein
MQTDVNSIESVFQSFLIGGLKLFLYSQSYKVMTSYKVVTPIGRSGSVSDFIFVFHPRTNLKGTNQSDQPNHTDFLLLTSSSEINVSFRMSL